MNPSGRVVKIGPVPKRHSGSGASTCAVEQRCVDGLCTGDENSPQSLQCLGLRMEESPSETEPNDIGLR